MLTDAECDDEENNGFGRSTWFNASFSILMNGGITAEKPYSKRERAREREHSELIPIRMDGHDQLLFLANTC